MDLRNNAITVGELLDNAEARAVLRSEFPEFKNPIVLRLARGMRLGEVLKMSEERIEPEKVEAVLDKLRAI